MLERVTGANTLEKQLQPILTQIRVDGLEPQARYQLVKDYFDAHEENMAASVADLTYLCRLPNEDRYLLTYPVIGNWFLDKISTFQSSSPHLEKAYVALRNLIKEERFCNSHMKKFYDDAYGHNKRMDSFNSLLLTSPYGSKALDDLLEQITSEICHAVYYEDLPVTPDDSTDLGHGLASPAKSFDFLTWHLSVFIEHRGTKPLDLTIMVVDDEHPEEWYERMISIGFKNIKSQKGYFRDCESALKALKKGHYNVILSDLNLGEGKMNGVEFVEKAYDLQKRKGINPMISVFSDDREALEAAEKRLRSGDRETYKIFNQVSFGLGLKQAFTAVQFRMNVDLELEKRSQK